MFLSETVLRNKLAHSKTVAAGYTLLETLIAFVVLVVFVVLAYSLAFRSPTSSKLKPHQTAGEHGSPEAKPRDPSFPAEGTSEPPVVAKPAGSTAAR